MVKAVNEITAKLSFLRSLAASHGVDALLLQRVSSVAWATSGAAVYVNTAHSEGEASLLITREKQFLFTNNIEAPRLEKEEGLVAQGWEFSIVPWYETNHVLQELTGRSKLAADGLFPGVPDFSSEIAHLRANLTPTEGGRSGPWAGSAPKPWIPLSTACIPVRPNTRSLVSWRVNPSTAACRQPSF